MTTEIRGDLAGSMSMTLRRGAHRGVAGTKSLSFFEGAVKPSLNPQGVGKSRPQRFSCHSAAGGAKEFAGLAPGKIKAGTTAATSLLKRNPPEWRRAPITKTLRRPGVRILSLLIQWINSYRHRLPAASAGMPALASSQKQTLCGQNDDIEFRRTTLILHV